MRAAPSRGVRVARDQCGLVRACCTSAWLISDRESSLVAGYSDERRLVESYFWAINREHLRIKFRSPAHSAVTPVDARKDPTSRSGAARRSADAAARRHAWAGAAHPEPAPVPCGQPVVAAHMLTADDR